MMRILCLLVVLCVGCSGSVRTDNSAEKITRLTNDLRECENGRTQLLESAEKLRDAYVHDRAEARKTDDEMWKWKKRFDLLSGLNADEFKTLKDFQKDVRNKRELTIEGAEMLLRYGMDEDVAKARIERHMKDNPNYVPRTN